MAIGSIVVRCTLRLLLARENVRRAETGEDSLTQARLADASGLPPSVVNGLVTGRTQRVDFKTIDALCKTLGVQPGDLFTWEPDTAPAAGGAL